MCHHGYYRTHTNIGVSAVSSGPLVTITSDSPNTTTYRNATAAGATETITFNAPANGSNTVTVDGTVTTSDVVTINVYDAGLTGGTKAISYTVGGGATTTSIATNLATNVNADTDLAAIGVTATSSSNVVNLKSSSTNATTYSTSLSSGATETLSLSQTTSSTAYGYNALNELTNISSGGFVRWQGTSNKAIASAQVATPVVRLSYARSFGTSYSFPNYNSTDEVLSTSMGTGKDLITVGGSKRTGDNVQIKVSSPELSGGSTTVSYVVQSADTLSTIATALASALTSNTTLSGIGLSATASGAVISVFTYPTYSKSVSGTETVTLGPNMQGTANATIGGTVTTSDTVSITVTDTRLSGGSKTKTYTVQSGDKLTNIAAGLASAVNLDTDLQSIGVTAIANPSLQLAWTQRFSGDAPTSPGTTENRVSITDAQPSTKTNAYQLTVSGFGYSPAVSGTETITFGTNVSGNTTATIGGTKTTADILNITAYGAGLPNGSKTVSYTVLSGDDLASIATGLKNAINADTDLANAGITATSSSAVITVASSGGLGRTLTYDLNGNLTSDGINTYEWDVENRLTKITYPGSGNHSDFSYDAFGRNIKIVEVTGGTTTSTKQFVWCELDRCEERDGSGTLVKSFAREGQMNGAAKYFYAADHLGSIRQFTDVNEVVQADYDFNAWGERTTFAENVPSDFKFGGYIEHSRSGLSLTVTRAYSPALGRFISRDILAESAGSNLFAYVGNSPESNIDPIGTRPFDWDAISQTDADCAWQCLTEPNPLLLMSLGYGVMGMPISKKAKGLPVNGKYTSTATSIGSLVGQGMAQYDKAVETVDTGLGKRGTKTRNPGTFMSRQSRIGGPVSLGLGTLAFMQCFLSCRKPRPLLDPPPGFWGPVPPWTPPPEFPSPYRRYCQPTRPNYRPYGGLPTGMA